MSENALPAAISIRNKAKEQLKNIGPELQDGIVNKLVSLEKERRLEILTTAFQTRETLDKERNRMKPDVVTHGEEENDKQARWSDASFKKKNKLDEALKKLDAAIENSLKADATNDEWTKLEKATNEAVKNAGSGKSEG